MALLRIKISQVEEVVQKLKEKHGSLYSIEKLNAWAHMIDIAWKARLI